MPTASESRRALTIVADEAVAAAVALVPSTDRAALLTLVPDLIDYYSLGTSALAADFYDDERESARVSLLYLAEPFVPERGEKVGRAVAWATELLGDDDLVGTQARLAEVVQLETARPYRATILENTRRDPAAAGWRRISRGDGCKLCRMLADRGAVYRQETARFAAHENCNCSAQPVFKGGDVGEEASALQYLASRRRTSAKDRARLRTYLNENFPDAHG